MIFEKSGREIELHSADGTLLDRYKGFIQPLRYKNRMYLDGINTEIGFNSQGHYLYIGPPEIDLTEVQSGAYLSTGSVKYQIDRAEKVFRRDQPFYIWAIIRTIVEVDE